jgi:hypothetical protein
MECRLAQVGKVLIMCEPLIAYRFQVNANTYRVYAEMRDKSRWTKDSYKRRLQSIPELTFDQFMFAQPKDVWSRLNRFRKDSSKLHMRTAGNRYLDGQYVAAAGHLFAGCLLNPVDIARRVRRYIVHS